MSIKQLIKSIIRNVYPIITNPNLYVAAIVGAIIGGLAGGAIGLFSGGFIGYAFQICNDCVAPLYNMNPNIIVGSILGLVIGTALGGAFTAVITMYKIFKKTSELLILTPDNITPVLLGALRISIEIAIGMVLGAIIGSLKAPGMGSILGAVTGVGLMLFTTTLEKKNGSIVLPIKTLD